MVKSGILAPTVEAGEAELDQPGEGAVLRAPDGHFTHSHIISHVKKHSDNFTFIFFMAFNYL